jgi:hypothetical protein
MSKTLEQSKRSSELARGRLSATAMFDPLHPPLQSIAERVAESSELKTNLTRTIRSTFEAGQEVTDRGYFTAGASNSSRFSMVPDRVFLEPGLSAAALKTWIGLRRHADENGRCWLSISSTLHEELQLSRHQVQYAIQSLVRHHLLTVAGPCGLRTVNTYQVLGMETRTSNRLERQAIPAISIEDSVPGGGCSLGAHHLFTGCTQSISLDLERDKDKDSSFESPNAPPLSLPAPISNATKSESETERELNKKVQELWNTAASAAGMPQVKSLDSKRRSLVRKAVSLYGLDGLAELIQKAVASDFLSGRAAKSPGHESWRCSFDWFFTAHNLLKLSEGAYDNAGSPTTIQRRSSISAPGSWDDAVDTIHANPNGGTTFTAFPEQSAAEVLANKTAIKAIRDGLLSHPRATVQRQRYVSCMPLEAFANEKPRIWADSYLPADGHDEF